MKYIGALIVIFALLDCTSKERPSGYKDSTFHVYSLVVHEVKPIKFEFGMSLDTVLALASQYGWPIDTIRHHKYKATFDDVIFKYVHFSKIPSFLDPILWFRNDSLFGIIFSEDMMGLDGSAFSKNDYYKLVSAFEPLYGLPVDSGLVPTHNGKVDFVDSAYFTLWGDTTYPGGKAYYVYYDSAYETLGFRAKYLGSYPGSGDLDRLK